MTNTLIGWKLLVVALVGYSLYITNKLLDLTDDAYSLAHEAMFKSVSDEHSLLDTVWGKKEIDSIKTVMYLLGLLAAVAIIAEVVVARRARAATQGSRTTLP